MNKQLPLFIVSAIAIVFITLFFYERGQAKERVTITHEEIIKAASSPVTDAAKPVEDKANTLVEGPVGITPPTPTPTAEQQDDIDDSVAAAVAAVKQAKAAEKAKSNKLDKWAVRINPETDGDPIYPSQRVTGPNATYKSAKTASGNLRASLAMGCGDFVMLAESNYDVTGVTCKNLYGLGFNDGSAYFLAKLSYKGKQYALTVPVDNQGRYGDLELEPWE